MTCDFIWGIERWTALLIDVLILSLAVILLICVECGILTPFKTIGFYCNDPKLNFKNNGDTVSITILLLVSFLMPCVIFIVTERFFLSSVRKTTEDSIIHSLWIKKTRFWLFRYIHGLSFTFFVTVLSKLLIGEPRPHFFHTCEPQYDKNSCAPNEYFSVYNCTNKAVSSTVLIDSYKSFPSGHASFSCYFAFFFVSYFAQRIKTNSHFLTSFLQLVCIGWALLCSLTRITDHRHHWWDVLTGSILGVAVAAYFIRYQPSKMKNVLDIEKNNKNFQSHLINSNE